MLHLLQVFFFHENFIYITKGTFEFLSISDEFIMKTEWIALIQSLISKSVHKVACYTALTGSLTQITEHSINTSMRLCQQFVFECGVPPDTKLQAFGDVVQLNTVCYLARWDTFIMDSSTFLFTLFWSDEMVIS